MPKRILVIEDDQPILELVVDILRDEGHDVVGASDGREGLDVISGTPPDLIVLDMRMPFLNGWDVANALNERGVHIPILVMTAATDAREWASEVGAAGYLSKPFDVDELVRSVDEILAAGREDRRLHVQAPGRHGRPLEVARALGGWLGDAAARRVRHGERPSTAS